MTLQPFIIDCDTGRDDALTFWLALALNQPLVAAVTSYGNTTLDNVTDNTARVLGLAGRNDIPLYAAAGGPLQHHTGFEEIVLPRQAVAGNGLCNLELPHPKRDLTPPLSPEGLAEKVETLAAEHGKLDYVITGPATNFGALCRLMGAKLHDYVSTVTMMGGKLSPLWEEIPGGADFNLVADPYAIGAILENSYAIRFVPMNVTWPVMMTLEEVEALNATSEIGQISKDLMIAHCKHFAPEPVFRFHDPCVISAALRPEHFKQVKLDIVLDEASSDFGRLVETSSGLNAFIYQADEVIREAFLAQILDALGLTR